MVSDTDAAVAMSEPPPVEDVGPPGDAPAPPELPPPGLLPLGASPCPPSALFGALPSGLVGVLPSAGFFVGELGVDALTSGVDTLTVGVATSTSGVFTLTPGSETPTLGTVTPMLGTVTPTLGTVTPMLGSVIPTLGSDSPMLGTVADTFGSDGPPDALPSESRPCASATPPVQSDTHTPISEAVSAARTPLARRALNSHRARAERALTRAPSKDGRSCCQSQHTAAQRPLRVSSARTHARDRRPWHQSAHIPRMCRSRAPQTSACRRPRSR